MVNQLLSIKPEDPARLYVLQDFLSYMKGFISLPIPLPGTGYTNAIKVRSNRNIHQNAIIGFVFVVLYQNIKPLIYKKINNWILGFCSSCI